MSDEKRDVCCNCGREIKWLETPIDDMWIHSDNGLLQCDETRSLYPIVPSEFLKHVAYPRDKRWESVYVATERVPSTDRYPEHTFISIRLVFYGIQLSQDFHLHPDNEEEKYMWIEKGVEAMDRYLDEAGFQR